MEFHIPLPSGVFHKRMMLTLLIISELPIQPKLHYRLILQIKILRDPTLQRMLQLRQLIQLSRQEFHLYRAHQLMDVILLVFDMSVGEVGRETTQ